MTDDMMTLRTLLEKSSDADLLREMIGFTAQRLMALEVEGVCGAGLRPSARRRASTTATAIASGPGRRAPALSS